MAHPGYDRDDVFPLYLLDFDPDITIIKSIKQPTIAITNITIDWFIKHAIISMPSTVTGIIFDYIPSYDSNETTYSQQVLNVLLMRWFENITINTRPDAMGQLCNRIRNNKTLKRLSCKYITCTNSLVSALNVNRSVKYLCIGTHYSIDNQSEIIHSLKYLCLNELIISFNHLARDSNLDMPRDILRALKRSGIKRIGFDSNYMFTHNNVEQQIASVCKDSSMTHLIIRGRISCPTIHFMQKLPMRITSVDLCGNDISIDTLHALLAQPLTEIKCKCDDIILSSDAYMNIILRLIALNTTILRFDVGMSHLLRSEINECIERNRSITIPAIAAKLFDIAIILLPVLDEVYCILAIFDWMSPHYYKYVSGQFKAMVLHRIANKIREIQSLK